MFKNIQMLRAVAAAMVFVYHAAPHYQAMGGGTPLFAPLASLGFAGVDIFFVISGFVAALTTFGKARTLQNALGFLRRRLLRIYLGYWPFLLATLGLMLIFKPTALGELDLVGSFFLTTIQLNRLVIFVTWSLSFELLFYLIVTASFALPVRWLKPLVLLASAGLLTLLIATVNQAHSQLQLFLSMLLEFLAGVLIFVYKDKLAHRAYILPCALIACAAFALGFHLHATDGSTRVLVFGTGAVALFVLALVLERSQLYVANRMWVALGDASYTLYLSHVALLGLFYYVGLRDLLAAQHMLLREAGFFAYFALCLWLSYQLYLRLEQPLYRWASAPRQQAAGTQAQPSSHGV